MNFGCYGVLPEDCHDERADAILNRRPGIFSFHFLSNTQRGAAERG
jgi:hypothetical protein